MLTRRTVAPQATPAAMPAASPQQQMEQVPFEDHSLSEVSGSSYTLHHAAPPGCSLMPSLSELRIFLHNF